MVVLRRGFDARFTQLSRAAFQYNVSLGGVSMYCGAVEFVCSPASVKHIPVLLDECMACLRPEREGCLLI